MTKSLPPHTVMESRMCFTLKCGTCKTTWKVFGCRSDDLSGFDLEDGCEETCPTCGAFRVVLTGDEERDALILDELL